MRVLFSTFILLFFPAASEACSVCNYGDPTQSAAVGLRYGVITLLSILFVVMIFFVKFIISFNKRTKFISNGN